MEIVMKHRLPDSTGNELLNWFNEYKMDPSVILPTNTKQGRTLIDSMDVPHILYNKTAVMEYNGIEYTLYHRPLFDAVKELLSNSDIFKHCVFDYTPSFATNDKGELEHCYGEQYSSKWWSRTQASISKEAKVLSIIFYSDATTCDVLGKTSEHPVYLTLGNIPIWRRNKPDAKALLAYLPKIEVSDDQKKTPHFTLSKYQLFHHSMEVITEQIRSIPAGGIELYTDNGLLWCYPFLSEMLGDLPEHSAITLTYNSANCNMPCHLCLTHKEEFNNPLIDYKSVILRTPETMKQALQQGLAKEYSLYDIENSFWSLPYVLLRYRL